MANKRKLYFDLFDGFKSAYPDNNAQWVQSETNAFWSTVKCKDDVTELVEQKLCELNRKKQRVTANLLTFWSKWSTTSASTSANAGSEPANSTSEADSDMAPLLTSQESNTATSSSQQVFSTPAQDKLRNEIAAINADIQAIDCRKSISELSDEDKAHKKRLQKTLQDKTSQLRRKEKEQQRQKVHREARKHKLEKMFEKNPELRKELNMQPERGRPSLDTSQPSLLSAIVEIATYGCAADDRRRTDNLRSVKTLDELTEALVCCGYSISCSGVYLRLLPRRSDTQEGKCHEDIITCKEF